MENNDSMNFQRPSDQNIEKYIFRVTLSYLQSLFTTISGEMVLLSELETYQQISAPWLGRSKFRKKLVDHGDTIGLQCSKINFIQPAVEESAAWLRKWCPVVTKNVDVEFELCGNFLTLIANVNIATDTSIVDAAKQMLSFRKSTGVD